MKTQGHTNDDLAFTVIRTLYSVETGIPEAFEIEAKIEIGRVTLVEGSAGAYGLCCTSQVSIDLILTFNAGAFDSADHRSYMVLERTLTGTPLLMTLTTRQGQQLSNQT